MRMKEEFHSKSNKLEELVHDQKVSEYQNFVKDSTSLSMLQKKDNALASKLKYYSSTVKIKSTDMSRLSDCLKRFQTHKILQK